MLSEQLKILEKIVNEEIKEIKKEGKQDFLTKEEFQDYTKNYNNIDEFIEVKKST